MCLITRPELTISGAYRAGLGGSAGAVAGGNRPVDEADTGGGRVGREIIDRPRPYSEGLAGSRDDDPETDLAGSSSQGVGVQVEEGL